ncbi:unnamed protein product [Periconia digitata]|uniref:Ankyrin n=1 Tax=Periconia digitata TaxID=1303443 RepID=A0A9W4UR70_9PLEO|nr:unnamed protein product [Periconia digitata]
MANNMPLPDLPLELIRLIIRFTCQSYKNYQDVRYLSLRRINQSFNLEVLEIYYQNVGVNINLNEMSIRELLQMPDVFAGRILQEGMGINDSRISESCSHMHAVADVLTEQFERAGNPCFRKSILHDIGRAIFKVRPDDAWIWIHVLMERKEQPTEPWVGPIDRHEAMRMAFVVAVAMNREEVVRQMLRRGEASATAYSRFLHSPLPPAIKFGHENILKLLLDAGAEIPRRPFGIEHDGPRGELYSAVTAAAKRGYTGVLEPLLQRDSTKELTHQVLKFTAQFGHWDLVNLIMDRHLTHEQWNITLTKKRVVECSCHPGEPDTFTPKTMQRVVQCAARDGKNELLLRLIRGGLIVRNNATGTKKFPLQLAAEGGHFSTCKLLLDHGALDVPEEYEGEVHNRNRVDSLVRAVATGGNMDILHLFQNRGLWSRTSALQVLPIAAENGHLEMAKYAVEHGMDFPTKRKTLSNAYIHDAWGNALCIHCQRSTYQHDLRYFAFLRAVAFGHMHVVRWLAEQLHINSDQIRSMSDWSSTYALRYGVKDPILYIIDTGNIDMLLLLQQYVGKGEEVQTNPFHEDEDTVFGTRCRDRVVNLSSHYPVELGLGRRPFREYKLGKRHLREEVYRLAIGEPWWVWS